MGYRCCLLWQQGPPAFLTGPGAPHRQRRLPQLFPRVVQLCDAKGRAMPRATPALPWGTREILVDACAAVGGKAQGRLRSSTSGSWDFASLTQSPSTASQQPSKPVQPLLCLYAVEPRTIHGQQTGN